MGGRKRVGVDLLLNFEHPVEAFDIIFLIAYLVPLSCCAFLGPGSPSSSETVLSFRCVRHHLEASYLTTNALNVLIRLYD